MAIQHMDNFSIYGTSIPFMRDGIYSEADGQMVLDPDPDGLSGGRVLKTVSSAADNARLRYPYSAPAAVIGCAMRVWCSPLPTTDADRPTLIDYRNGSNVSLATIKVTTTGALVFDDGVNVITTPGPVITANAWWHIEMKYTRSGTGAIEIRVEGIPVMNTTNLSYVAAGNIAQVATLGGRSNFTGTLTYYKDYILYDGTGTYNNNFLGSVLVTNLIPQADVALNWTPSTGTTGAAILDNVPPVDTQFISAASPAPAAYRCSLTNLPSDVTSVKAVMTIVRAAKTDGGDGSLQVSLISNGDTGNGANRPITVAQTYWRDVFDTDPDTGSPWIPAAVDAATLQINRTT